MRSPGVVYRRYRQLRRKILYDRLDHARACIPDNCFYCSKSSYIDSDNKEKSINICSYGNINESHIEICSEAHSCNAFINKWTREAVVEQTEKIFTNYAMKKSLYPELTVLEWVLDKDLNDALENPGLVGAAIIWCINLLENLLKINKS
jgi:hypothetical protein